MTDLYPLRFRPIFRRYLWGGRRLATVLGKAIGPGDGYAESWEICDHGADQSVVAAGPLAGTSLHELVTQRGAELFGRHAPQGEGDRSMFSANDFSESQRHRAEKWTSPRTSQLSWHLPQPRFPLLLKFLDAAERLSVQVHPHDAQAARLNPPDLGKTEAWVILAAEPESVLWAGLRPGVDREQLAQYIDRGECDACLHRIQPVPGDCIFVPAGTVHALGAGLLVAEIQQASDVTYRLYDWNRVGPDGKPRALHVQQALDVIDFQRGPVEPQQPKPINLSGGSRLVECDKFVLDRWEFEEMGTFGGDQRCHILAVIEGSVTIDGDPAAEPLPRGGTILLPASLGAVTVRPGGRGVVLDMYQP